MNSVPYSHLAKIYDRVMTHVNYPMWSDFALKILKNKGIKNILDISCGTGKHLQMMGLKGADIFAADISTAMLREAQKNLMGRDIFFITQDACFNCIKDENFDAVIMLYDSINYITNQKNVLNLFRGVKRILRKDGLFLFDFVTQEGLRDCFDDYFESDSWGGLAYERHSWYSVRSRMLRTEFLLLHNGKSFKEVHRQKIRTSDEWEKLVKKSNMKLLDKFSNFKFIPVSEKSERVHFVCQV